MAINRCRSIFSDGFDRGHLKLAFTNFRFVFSQPFELNKGIFTHGLLIRDLNRLKNSSK